MPASNNSQNQLTLDSHSRSNMEQDKPEVLTEQELTNSSTANEINDDSASSGSDKEFTVIDRDIILTKQPLSRHLDDIYKQSLRSEILSSLEEKLGQPFCKDLINSSCDKKEIFSLVSKIEVLEKINEELVCKMKEMEEKSKKVEQEDCNLKEQLMEARQRILDLEQLAKVNGCLPPTCLSFLPNSNAPPKISELLQNLQKWMICQMETELQEKKLLEQTSSDTNSPNKIEDWKKLLEETKKSVNKHINRMESISHGMTLVEDNVWGQYTSLLSLNSFLKTSDGVTLNDVFTEILRGFKEKKDGIQNMQTLLDKVDQYQALEESWKKFEDGVLDKEMKRLSSVNESMTKNNADLKDEVEKYKADLLKAEHEKKSYVNKFKCTDCVIPIVAFNGYCVVCSENIIRIRP